MSEEKKIEVTVLSTHQVWRSRFGFAFGTFVIVMAIGSMRAWFGGSFIVEIMLMTVWIMSLIIYSQHLPSVKRNVIATHMTVDEIRAALSKGDGK